MKKLLTLKICLNVMLISLVFNLLLFTGCKAYANTGALTHLLDDLNTLAQQQAKQSPKAMLFVSFSLPESSLKSYLHQAARLDIPVYIRGLHQGSLLKTQQKIARLLANNQGGMAIDPTKFSQFNIKQVPSLVIAKTDAHFDQVAGHVTLMALVQAIADEGEQGRTIAQDLLARMNSWEN